MLRNNDEDNKVMGKIKDMLINKFKLAFKFIGEKQKYLFQNYNDSEEEDNELYQYSGETLGTVLNTGVVMTDDVGDIEDEDDLEMDDDYLEESVDQCNRVLRFLQLLTENHNLGLQNFLREQTSGGIVKTKTFNFVSYVANMFGIYQKSFVN
jgi:hypothetical protein